MSKGRETQPAQRATPFSCLLQTRLSRRKLLAGGLASAASTFFVSTSTANAESPPQEALATPFNRNKNCEGESPLVGFRPVLRAEGIGPWPAISEDYEFEILIPWGEPIRSEGPRFQWPPNALEQTQQIGIGHDGMAFFPFSKNRIESNTHGLLAINHEYGTNIHILGKLLPENLEEVRALQAAHGLSILEIKNEAGAWRQVDSAYNRRAHVNTPVRFSGPAANDELLKTPNGFAPRGTLANCANGRTPWGTYLTCEEGTPGYFGANGDWSASEAQRRYGFSEKGFGVAWHSYDPRFDLSNPDYRNEENRFGWVVEIDPFDPNHVPVKRTALGRFKHEGVAVTVGGHNRIVAYMGDDQRFDYIYKFVSSDDWRQLRKKGISPLDVGKLYAARFDANGTGEWLELTIENELLAKNFKTQSEILIYTRLAADLLGATPMDRPEWTSVAPSGDVYCSLTNNSAREQSDHANPTAPNLYGHIIKWRDQNQHLGTRFNWDVFVIAETTQKSEDTFSNPDGLWADPNGRLFIQTDGAQEGQLNNQMLVANTQTGELKRLFTGVAGSEITGITSTPDQCTMFINVQHPGRGSPKSTNFPAPYDGKTIPRDCTIAIRRKDGGIVGS